MQPNKVHEDLGNYWSVTGVAELFGVTARSVYSWIKQGLLPTHQDGNKKYISSESLETFEQPAKKGLGRPKGSRNRKKKKKQQQQPKTKVAHLQPVPQGSGAAASAAARRLKLEHGGRADEISSVLNSLGAALTESAFLIEKLNVAPTETAQGGSLRTDLRAAHRLLRRSYDFLIDAENVTFKAETKAEELSRDISREIRGS